MSTTTEAPTGKALKALSLVDVVRQELGEWVPEDFAVYVLWNHTGYPCFWNIPEDGESPLECIRTSVRRYAAGDCCEERQRETMESTV